MTLVHALFLLLLAFVLLLLELFLPSGGLLGLSAVAAVIAAIVVGFLHSFAAGAWILTIVALGTPLIIWLGLRLWPYTPIGKRMLNLDPEQDAARRREQEIARGRWVGKRGIAKMDLLPNGRVLIDGQLVDAISSGSVIERGEPVEVVSMIAGKIQVRRATSRTKPADDPAPSTGLSDPTEADLPYDEILNDQPAGGGTGDRGSTEPQRRAAEHAAPRTDTDAPVHPLEYPIESLESEDWDEPTR